MRESLLNSVLYKVVSARNLKVEFLRLDVNIFNRTASRVMGWRFDGSFVTPFLCTSTVHAIFHADGIVPEDQTVEIS